MRVYVLPIALILCGLAVASPAWAQGKPDFAAARKHYQTAQEAEKAGNFDMAVAEYAAAYDITKDPKILYSVAHAYELGGNKDAAIVYYRRYVNEAKDAKDRDDVKKRIAELEGASAPAGGGGKPAGGDGGKPTGGDGATGTGATGTGTTEPGGAGNDLVAPDLGGGKPGGDTGTGETPPDGTQPPAFVDQGGRWQRTAAWVSVGIAAVALTTGAVLGESALSREEDIQRLQDYRNDKGLPTTFNGNVAADYQDAVDDGKAFETYSLVAFSLAGAATVAAVVFFVMDPGPAEAPPAVTTGARKAPKQTARRSTWIAPAISPEGAGLTVGWGF